MRVIIKTEDQTRTAERLLNVQINRGLETMAQSTIAIARAKTPKKSGWLRYSGHVIVEESPSSATGLYTYQSGAVNTYWAIFGHERVPYAAYQEFGGDGRRVIRNYTTPGTGKFFLRDAAERVRSRGFEAYV